MGRKARKDVAAYMHVRGKGKKKKTVVTEGQALKKAEKMAQGNAELINNNSRRRTSGAQNYRAPEAGDWEDLPEFDMANNRFEEEEESAVSRILSRQRPKRRNAQRRENIAANWQQTEDMISDYLADPTGDTNNPTCTYTGTGTQNIRPRRFITLENYEVREMGLCPCGCTLAEIAREGYFSATPQFPETFFGFHLLRTLIEQSNAGSISRTAWGDGLRKSLSRKCRVDLPSFTRLLRDAYHHFLASIAKFEAQLDHQLEVYANLNFRREALRNTCPACFYFGPEDQDRAVHIAVDGNMQHTRILKRGEEAHEKLPLRALIRYGYRDYPYAKADRGNAAGCTNSFKATKDDTGPATITTKKALDETGLMGMCCNHGSFLRALNFYKSGERQSHAIELVKHVFEEVDDLSELRICYDVACRLEGGVWRPGSILDPTHASRVSCRINRFHIYGHQYRCHVLYNTLRTEGWGLTNGEEIERLWASIRHLIRAGRMCTGPRRAQRIDAALLHLARCTRESMGRNLARRAQNSDDVQQKHRATLQLLLGTILPNGNCISEHYIKDQVLAQENHYKHAPGDSLMDDGDSTTQKARWLQRRIVQILVNSAVEMAEVERCTRSLRNAEHFTKAIKGRSKKLNKAVRRYNASLCNLSAAALGPRALDPQVLREEGLDCDELWDIDRHAVLDDWAVYPQVRMAIDSYFRVQRALEERLRCKLCLQRQSKWVVDTSTHIMDFMEQATADEDGITQEELKFMLIHRQIIAKELIKFADILDLSKDEAQPLTAVLARMSDKLPEIAVSVDPDCDDGSEWDSVIEEDVLEGLTNLAVDETRMDVEDDEVLAADDVEGHDGNSDMAMDLEE